MKLNARTRAPFTEAVDASKVILRTWPAMQSLSEKVFVQNEGQSQS
jgi:hypothetical protein